MKRSFGGFTLLELLVTLAVFAILGSMAAPSMLQFVRDSRLRSLSGQLLADLQFARSEAIRRNGPVLMCAAVGCLGSAGSWSSGWSVCTDSNNDATCDQNSTASPNPLRFRAALDNGATLEGPTAGISFRPDGSQGVVGNPVQTLTLSGSWSGAPRYLHTVSGTGVIALKKT
jgi:type IV fimbrial biogenesis protein FimT